MKQARLLAKIKQYMEKIVNEDLIYLSQKRKNLSGSEWQFFFSNYKEDFIKNGRLLFEILIESHNTNNFFNKNDVRNISNISANKTLNEINRKLNLGFF
ncbi:MAG TPA: hypothetical protein PK771_09565 [Spirochaetota bacterium]|nr:hypothetical protein [Spirochaetota bacterium]